ncbi:hypothetical protein MD484_g297, partial [Candolleomyces efflorescens]
MTQCDVDGAGPPRKNAILEKKLLDRQMNLKEHRVLAVIGTKRNLASEVATEGHRLTLRILTTASSTVRTGIFEFWASRGSRPAFSGISNTGTLAITGRHV